MNDQLQQALAIVLQGATDAVSSGVSFLKAELPDVVSQLLLWKLASNFAATLFCLGVAVGAAWLLVKIVNAKEVGPFREPPREYQVKYEGKTVGDWSVFSVIGSGLACFSFLVSAPLAFSSAMTCLQIWLAPKIYLIEYAARLAGGK